MGEQARFRITFSAHALRDVEEIVDFIARDSPRTAERFGNRLIDEAAAIALYPRAGRMVAEFGDPAIRERRHGAYRIVYEIREEERLVVVARFWHSARGTPEIPEA